MKKKKKNSKEKTTREYEACLDPSFVACLWELKIISIATTQ